MVGLEEGSCAINVGNVVAWKVGLDVGWLEGRNSELEGFTERKYEG